MISRETRDIHFSDGLFLQAHAAINGANYTSISLLPGWKQYDLENHPSEHGVFHIFAICSVQDRLQLVMLCHQHAFYDPETPGDAERNAFHEGVILKELSGQKEFSWGQAFCRFDEADRKNRLIVAYSKDPQIPAHSQTLLSRKEHQPFPNPKDT